MGFLKSEVKQSTPVSDDALFFDLDADKVIEHLGTNREKGLSESEAKARLTRYGYNELEKEARASPFRILAKQFVNALIVILLVAIGVSAFLGEVIDALVILIIVILVAILGFTQEYRAERVLASLKNMLSRTAKVIRDGVLAEIPVEKLVPGDIVLVSSGDKISADMILIESFNVQTDEAVLTGESLPVSKNVGRLPSATPVAERTNMLFSGTALSSGKGTAVVTSTGMNTEFGKIAKEVSIESERKVRTTSLERRMDEIGKKIGTVVLIITIAIVVLSLAEEYLITGSVGTSSLIAILLFGVALAVAAIPEALPAIMVGSLAIGANRMAKNNALARNLSAVETLGETQVICTDKTGTLTKGEMTVKAVYIDFTMLGVSGVGYEPIGKLETEVSPPKFIIDEFARGMMLCNDAMLLKEEDNSKGWKIQGDPTEGALIVLAEKLGQPQESVRFSNPRVWEIPFSSETKRMTTIHSSSATKKTVAYMKGAPESVLDNCIRVETGSGQIALDSKLMERILQAAETMAAQELRVLAIARKDVQNLDGDKSLLEKEHTFLGLVGMMDPPRPEAIQAIKTATMVGMRPIMITGDHKTTAVAIAREMGIYREKEDYVLTGKELEKLDDGEFEGLVERVSVYARVSPFDKLRIVEAWKRKDRIVAMTGDGVNDAPALKRADIGIAMGITGTEVAKDASDLILLDDNFATIIKAIELGRWIKDNVKKYLVYLLSANLMEIVVMTAGVLLASFLLMGSTTSEPLVPLLAVQLLYINLATDGLPALAVGIGPPDPDVMKRQVPKQAELSVFSGEVRRFITWILIFESPLLVLVYLGGLSEGIDAARTRLFLAFVFSELTLALSCRSLRFPIVRAKPGRWLILAVIWETVLMIVLLQIPAARSALNLSSPTLTDFWWILLAVLVTFVYAEILKLVINRGGRQTYS